MLIRNTLVIAALVGSGCQAADKTPRAVCKGDVLCGFFEIAKSKESTPIFFAGAVASPLYRLCVEKGSIILQTIEADGNAKAIGGEIHAGNCADVSFADQVYILGNTGTGAASGFYYRVP